jgi:hypothetical protein
VLWVMLSPAMDPAVDTTPLAASRLEETMSSLSHNDFVRSVLPRASAVLYAPLVVAPTLERTPLTNNEANDRMGQRAVRLLAKTWNVLVLTIGNPVDLSLWPPSTNESFHCHRGRRIMHVHVLASQLSNLFVSIF